ncbi:MAG: hypothetical protein MK100_06685 [Phycisphaerales bacterium]|nr:hypothetical protein [Phycisphaerales bacterium]
MLRRMLVLPLLLAFTSAALAQTATPLLEDRSMSYSSGVVQNDGADIATVSSHVLSHPFASSMQVRFGRTKLSDGSFIRITSLTDGAVQHQTSETLKQWQYCSAWFNGSHVLVELVMSPDSKSSHLSIEGITSMLGVTDERSICFSVDDRVLSYDDRSARVAPIGCTGWLINDATRQFMTAGHCIDNLSVVDVMEFNVPLSNGDGSWNHPGPEDQYPVDDVSVQFTDGGIGNDWSYYGCFPNTETGLTAYEVQGVTHILAAAAPAVDGRDITITGYGSTSAPVDPSWYGVQKTHTGPYMHNSGYNVGYQTDTTGGNSGSPVLDEVTGMAIGIHTHAGCDSNGGYNNGTAIEHPDLQYALDNPLGVCILTALILDFPEGHLEVVWPGNQIPLQFTVSAGDEIPDPKSIELIMTINGNIIYPPITPLGDDLYEAMIPALSCDQVVKYYISATSTKGTLATLPLNAPETQYDLLVGELIETTLLSADFDDGIPSGWDASGLWHAASTACAGSGSCGINGVMYFGQDGSCDYDTGNTEEGVLATNAISLNGIAGPYQLTYCTHLETENLDPYDAAVVLVNGVEVDRATEGGWSTRTVEIDSINGNTAVVSFSFDTGDSQFNDYTGWHLDHVELVAQEIDCNDVDPCPADINGSGAVDTDDILQLIADWGALGGDSDIDNDGIVGTDDLLALIGAWGPC